MGAAELYRLLMADHPSESLDDGAFLRHVLASALALAHGEAGSLDHALGLSPHDLTTLLLTHFPHAAAYVAGGMDPTGSGDAAIGLEEPDLRQLLLDSRSHAGQETVWLAHIIARRSLRGNHLWQDLGLTGRADLSRLMRSFFAPLAQANDRDMKWKKFFYRTLCQREGVLICKSPICDTCDDFAVCFGAEDGHSLLAQNARVSAGY